MRKLFFVIIWGSVISSCNISYHSIRNMGHNVTTDNSLNHKYVLFSQKDINYIKKHKDNLYEILKKGNKYLNYKPSPVRIFAPDPHYNEKGENKTKNNGAELKRDWRTAYTLALCYLITDNPKYAISAQNIINVWTNTLYRIGSRQGKDEINFNAPYLIIAASIVKDVNHWDYRRFNRFLRTIILPNSLRSNSLNHGLWAVFMEACASSFLNDRNLMKQSKDRWEEILKGEINSDGIMPKEMERSGTSNWRGGPDKGKKGIAYTHYTLLPATLAAKIYSEYYGNSVWYSEAGKLMKKAFHRAAAWSLHPETFPYYHSNGGKLVGVNNYSYFPILIKYYRDANASQILQKAPPQADSFMIYLLIH